MTVASQVEPAMTNRAYLLPDTEPSIALAQSALSEVEYQKCRFVDDAGVIPGQAKRIGSLPRR